MIFGIKEKSIILTYMLQHIVGYCYKYTRVTYDWFCGPGSYTFTENKLFLLVITYKY